MITPHKFRVIFFSLVLFLIVLLVSNLQAGVTGKISGKIIDEKTKEPMPGVNVIIKGTTMGAASDMEGYYLILNVPPGVYSVTAFAIGYKKLFYQEVKVSIDLTTRIDFNLTETVLELGETIYVIAERPLITKDLTASTAIISSQDIELMPVTEFQEILELQAGVIAGHVRGGRTGEIVYAIDGVSITDTYDGSTVIDVNTNSIQELQFVSGAFNAEYGKALSGYVNIVTKEAEDKISAGITTYSGDYVSNHTNIFRAIDKVDPLSIRNIEGYFSSPIIQNKLSFYGNIRYVYFGGWLHGERVYNPWDITINKGPAAPFKSRYEIQQTGDDKIVGMNWNSKIYGHGKLTYKPFNSLKLNYNFMVDRKKYQDYDHSFCLNPEGNLKRFRDSYTNILGITHMLTSATFYQINFSRFSKNYKHYVYENYQDPRYTHYRLMEQHPHDVPSFRTGGTINQHFNRKTSTFAVKFDITSQINKYHQIKFGTDISRYELKYKNITLLQEEGLPDPSESGNPYAAMRIPDPDDRNENLSINLYTRNPVEFSAYVQDKIELKQLIINIGLRFDSFFPDGQILTDPSDPDIYRPKRPENINKTLEQRKKYWYKDATKKYQLSPRLGVSFPISDQGVFHFSYGHFFQIPNYELLYQNPEYKFRIGTGNIGIAGNPDLKAEETINGEVGFSQALTDNLSLDITGYFRDIRNLAGTRADEIDMFGGSGSYSQIVNSDFGFVRGIVLTLNKRFSNNWSAKVDYTLQTAKGNASDPAATRLLLISGQRPEIQLIRLDFDQTHTINASFNYVSPKRLGFSLICQYGTGLPYTPTQSINISKLLSNSETKPSNINIDLKAHKDFYLGKHRFTVFTRIYNIFDIKNELNVYRDSGTADFTLEEYLRKLQNLPAVVNTIDEYYRIPTFYSEPRRIELGCSLYFNN